MTVPYGTVREGYRVMREGKSRGKGNMEREICEGVGGMLWGKRGRLSDIRLYGRKQQPMRLKLLLDRFKRVSKVGRGCSLF